VSGGVEDTGVELREISGPSPLGGGRRRALELLLVISATDFKRAYFGTALGYLWSLARPLLMFAVLLAVFSRIGHLSAGVPHYPELLLLNIVLFGFFQDSAAIAIPSVVAQESIVRKTQFPRLVIPLSVVLTSLFNLVLNLLVVLVFLLAAGITPRLSWLLLPLAIVPLLVVLTTAAAMILSSLYPRFRDIGIAWTVLSTALFYATPVIYALGHVGSGLQRFVMLNPFASILELSRRWVIDPRAPTPAALAHAWLIVPALLSVGFCVLAVWIFSREAPRIAEVL